MQGLLYKPPPAKSPSHFLPQTVKLPVTSSKLPQKPALDWNKLTSAQKEAKKREDIRKNQELGIREAQQELEKSKKSASSPKAINAPKSGQSKPIDVKKRPTRGTQNVDPPGNVSLNAEVTASVPDTQNASKRRRK